MGVSGLPMLLLLLDLLLDVGVVAELSEIRVDLPASHHRQSVRSLLNAVDRTDTDSNQQARQSSSAADPCYQGCANVINNISVLSVIITNQNIT